MLLLAVLPGGVGNSVAAASVGFLCAGLSVLGPDHLCALLSLTAATSPRQALAVGGSWGLAHCTGTVVVCIIFNAFRSWYASRIDPERWEKIGDYLIGLSLILCGLYFQWRESHYLTEHADGSITVQACACHPLPSSAATDVPEVEAMPTMPKPPEAVPRSKFRLAGIAKLQRARYTFCDGYDQCFSKDCGDVDCEADHAKDEETEVEPLLGNSEDPAGTTHISAMHHSRYYAGAFIGFLQGICCPMVFVSLNFFSSYVSTPTTTAVFILSYVFASAVGTALLASGWVCLVVSGLSDKISARVVYRTSVSFTLVFGVLWCAGNYFDILEIFDCHKWLHNFAPATDGGAFEHFGHHHH